MEKLLLNSYSLLDSQMPLPCTRNGCLSPWIIITAKEFLSNAQVFVWEQTLPLSFPQKGSHSLTWIQGCLWGRWSNLMCGLPVHPPPTAPESSDAEISKPTLAQNWRQKYKPTTGFSWQVSLQNNCYIFYEPQMPLSEKLTPPSPPPLSRKVGAIAQNKKSVLPILAPKART